jgi:putative molybdopterin biosynthesis protein
LENDLMSVQEVAALLKIARNTVYELIKRGELKSVKVGKQLRVSRVEINRYLSQPHPAEKPQVPAPPAPAEEESHGAKALRDETVLRGSELVICGKDMVLDILVAHISAKNDAIPVFRSPLGSYNGLYALYQGRVNVATAHIWDGETNTYNIPYVKKMMPGVPCVVLRIGQRMEGLYVQAGNPKSITGWEDFRRKDITMANREKGSGVRILIDEKLRLMGYPGEAIAGYDTELNTHLAVAARVAAGAADVGVGAELKMPSLEGVDFIPLQLECYDLVIRRADADKAPFRALMDVVTSQRFRHEVETLAGFMTAETGRIFYV